MNGLALFDALNGEIDKSEAMLAEADSIASAANVSAPGPTWMGGELARAHVALETGDEEAFARAMARLDPVRDRLEPWQLLVIAESEQIRQRRGVSWALHHALSAPRAHEMLADMHTAWTRAFELYHARLYMVLGNFSEAARIMDSMPGDHPALAIERARLALFSGDDVNALLLVQTSGECNLTKRELAARCLIAATAAYGCGRTAEAFSALSDGCTKVIESKLFTELSNVPYDALVKVVEAARDAGRGDFTELVASVPVPARAHRYERLTEMERRTLTVVAEHQGSLQEVAASMHVTPATVKKHMNAVYRKLKVVGRDAAIVQATRMGLLSNKIKG